MTKTDSALRRMFQVEHRKAWWVGTVVVLVALLAIQGVRYYWVGRCEKTLMGALDQDVQGPSKREGMKPQEDYKPITEKSLLGSVKKPPPPFSLWGILGREALMGPSADAAKPYEVGGKLPSGEEVIRMGINDVVLAKDGKERTVYVHDALKPAGASEPSPDVPPSPAAMEGGAPVPPNAGAAEVIKEPPSDEAEVKPDETPQNADASVEAKKRAAMAAAEQAAKEAAETMRSRIREASNQ